MIFFRGGHKGKTVARSPETILALSGLGLGKEVVPTFIVVLLKSTRWREKRPLVLASRRPS